MTVPWHFITVETVVLVSVEGVHLFNDVNVEYLAYRTREVFCLRSLFFMAECSSVPPQIFSFAPGTFRRRSSAARECNSMVGLGLRHGYRCF